MELTNVVQAISAAVVAVVTILIWRVGKRQADVSEQQASILAKQVELDRLRFTSDHRPRIVMREVNLIDGEQGRQILFALTNIGGSPGTLSESWFFLEGVAPAAAIRNPRSADHNDLGHKTFEAGEVADMTHTLSTQELAMLEPPKVPQNEGEARAYRAGIGVPDNVYFTGSVRYVDEAGTVRRSVFRRTYMHRTGGFERLEGTTHEYAD